MTWLPLYFQATYGFDIKSMGGAMAIIFLLCFVGQLTGATSWINGAVKAVKPAALCIPCCRFQPLLLA